MRPRVSALSSHQVAAMIEKELLSISAELKAMEENDSSLSFRELQAMKEKDSSRSQEQKAMEERDTFFGSQELKPMEDLQGFFFTSPGRKRVQAKRIPNSSSSAVANADSSAATLSDSTRTISTLPPPAFSSNALSVPPSSEDGGNSSFMATKTLRNEPGHYSFIVKGSELSKLPSVPPHLDIFETELSSPETIWSTFSTASPLFLAEDDFDYEDATADSQEDQFPNTEESSDPIMSLHEPNQQKTQKDNILSVTTGAQLPNCKVNAEEDPKDLPLMLVTRVLRGIPHCPHFIHLRGFSDLALLKLVEAWDRIFEAVVDEIRTLEIKDFWDRACQLWETMEELHELGYNMLLTRIRFVEMVDLMVEFKQSKEEVRSWKKEAEADKLAAIKMEMDVFDLEIWADDEEDSKVSVLRKIKQLERELPKFDDLVFQIARRPF